MQTNLQSAPSSPYGQFDEKGYHFEARMPAGSQERCAFLVSVSREGLALVALEVPMLHPPIFGVDVDDSAALDAVVDRLIASLPTEAFTEATYEMLKREFNAYRTTSFLQ